MHNATYTLDNQPIQSTCEKARMNKKCILLVLCEWDRVAEVTADICDGSGKRTYLSERSWLSVIDSR